MTPSALANDNITAISGVWKLTKVTQTDAESQRKGFPYAVEDITTLFNYASLQLTFNLSSGAPSTFTINNGSAPPITGITSGTWSVDDIKAPKTISLKKRGCYRNDDIGWLSQLSERQIKSKGYTDRCSHQ